MTEIYTKFHGDSCQEDWSRVKSLHQASVKSALFSSPEPLVLDIDKGTIDYEYLPEGELLAYRLFKAIIFNKKKIIAQLNQMFATLGRALFQFHQHYKLADNNLRTLSLSDDVIIGVKQETIKKIETTTVACHHGDFGMGNIWISEENQHPIIFDPIPSIFCPDRSATKASIYYDIGHMVSSLWCIYPLWVYPWINWSIIELFIASFLDGYEKESGQNIEKLLVYTVAVGLIDAYMGINKTTFSGFRGGLRKKLYLKRRSLLIKRIENG